MTATIKITLPYCLDCNAQIDNDVQFMYVIHHDIDGQTYVKTVCDVCLPKQNLNCTLLGTARQLTNGWIVHDTVNVNDRD